MIISKDMVLECRKDKNSSKWEELLKDMEKYVTYVARNYRNRNDYEDILQEVRILAIKSVYTYDINSEAQFHTYALSCMSYGIRRVVRNLDVIYRPPHIKSDEYLYEIVPSTAKDSDGMEVPIMDLEGVNVKIDSTEFNINLLKDYLDEKSINIIKCLLWGYSKSEIARALNISPQAMDGRVKVIEKKLKGKYIEL